MRDVPIWLGLGIWGVTLAGGAALGLGTGLHRGAQIERLRSREPLEEQVVAQVLFGDVDGPTLRRSLSWLATNHHDDAARKWAASELAIGPAIEWSPVAPIPPAPPAKRPDAPPPVKVAVQDLGESLLNPEVPPTASLAKPPKPTVPLNVAVQDLGETPLDPLPVPSAPPAKAAPPATAVSAQAKAPAAAAPVPTAPVRVAVVRNDEPPPPPAVPALSPEEVAAELASRFTAPAVAALAAPKHGQIVPGPVDTWQASGAAAARAFVASHISGWLPCYESALASVPTLSGVLDLTLEVVSGTVAEVHTVTNTLGGPDVATCVSQEVRGWTLPSEVNGRIGIPVHLRPAG